MKSIVWISVVAVLAAGCTTNSDDGDTVPGLLDQANHDIDGAGCGTLASPTKASQLVYFKYVEPTDQDVTYRAACVFEIPKTAANPATLVTLARIDYGTANTVCALVDDKDDVQLFFAARAADAFFPKAVSDECAAMPATATATAVSNGPLYCRTPGLDSPVTKTTEFKALAAGKLGETMDPCTMPVEKYLLKK